MPLNLGSDGDFTPYLKYNAKAGRFYIRPQGATEDMEVVNPRVCIDMQNIRTGWIYYPEGGGPEKVWDPTLSDMAPKPPGPKKFKRGFEVLVFGNDRLSNGQTLGLREWASNAANACAAINKMFEAYEAQANQNIGKVPFFACKGVTPINGAFGTNYEPKFEIIGWVERAKVPAFDEHLAGKSEVAPRHDPAPPPDENSYGGGHMPDDDIPF